MNKDPIAFLKQIARTIHRKHHNDSGNWDKCLDPVCTSIRMWIRDFKKDEKTWVTADHRVLLIKDMEDSHLYNSYNPIFKMEYFNNLEDNRH